MSDTDIKRNYSLSHFTQKQTSFYSLKFFSSSIFVFIFLFLSFLIPPSNFSFHPTTSVLPPLTFICQFLSLPTLYPLTSSNTLSFTPPSLFIYVYFYTFSFSFPVPLMYLFLFLFSFTPTTTFLFKFLLLFLNH